MATYIKNKTTGNWERSGWNGVLSFGFTGCVVPFAGAVEKVPAHWLVCDGSAVGRSEYPDLFDCIGETYGAGDGSTTFNLPDFRETALVGIGKNTTNVKDSTEGGTQNHDEYTLGEFKDDQIQTPMSSDVRLYIISGVAAGQNTVMSSYPYSGKQAYPSSNLRMGDVTRGKRKGVNYIIHI